MSSFREIGWCEYRRGSSRGKRRHWATASWTAGRGSERGLNGWKTYSTWTRGVGQRDSQESAAGRGYQQGYPTSFCAPSMENRGLCKRAWLSSSERAWRVALSLFHLSFTFITFTFTFISVFRTILPATLGPGRLSPAALARLNDHQIDRPALSGSLRQSSVRLSRASRRLAANALPYLP